MKKKKRFARHSRKSFYFGGLLEVTLDANKIIKRSQHWRRHHSHTHFCIIFRFGDTSINEMLWHLKPLFSFSLSLLLFFFTFSGLEQITLHLQGPKRVAKFNVAVKGMLIVWSFGATGWGREVYGKGYVYILTIHYLFCGSELNTIKLSQKR